MIQAELDFILQFINWISLYTVVLQALGNTRHYFFLTLISKSAAGCKAHRGGRRADGFLRGHASRRARHRPQTRPRLGQVGCITCGALTLGNGLTGSKLATVRETPALPGILPGTPGTCLHPPAPQSPRQSDPAQRRPCEVCAITLLKSPKLALLGKEPLSEATSVTVETGR